ncbi:MAG: DUF262 domain-containing protein [Paramuribaculum sp.]|nr:DUF262 domain-containing protein [Paramuribaculum sp.]
MATQLPLKESTISDIYLNNNDVKTYRIPIYQRNYAWDEDQISALIKDVKDAFDKDPDSVYYIGTLVTFKRDESVYEVIDGQQRLTTIFLILKALGQKNIDSKLTYSSRPISAKTLSKLPEITDEYDFMIKKGYDYAKSALTEFIPDSMFERFKNYFLENVIIIHYNVPKDVDLNHYFEVMNSRGEQLEKHEIVKSQIYGILDNETDRIKFSRIWDACAQMNCYIQQVLDDPNLFVNNYSDFSPVDFREISLTENIAKKECIADLLKLTPEKNDEEVKVIGEDKFQPIIDFSNFLLIVLKLTLFQNNLLDIKKFKLDDKELLEEFNDAINRCTTEIDKIKFLQQFTYNLLKAKYFLDNYVVHHTLSNNEDPNQNPWQLERFYKAGKDMTPRILGDKNNTQGELINLLSMFEVSFSPKTRKNYLFYILIHLFENEDVDSYLIFLRRLADKYFYDIYVCDESLNEKKQPKPDVFDSIIIGSGKLDVQINNESALSTDAFEKVYEKGDSDISLFVFNYTDYRLWKKYSDEMRGETLKESNPRRMLFFLMLGCKDFGLEPFNKFYFSRTRKSLEHFYPQANAADDDIESSDGIPTRSEINCFGNFAMIGADANSSGSNWDPIAKCNHYNSRKQNQVSVASLKFKIMMQICQDNSKDESLDRPQGLEWNYSDMRSHQKKMLEIIMKPNV